MRHQQLIFFPDFSNWGLVPEFKKKGKTDITIFHDNKFYHVRDEIISQQNGQLIQI